MTAQVTVEPDAQWTLQVDLQITRRKIYHQVLTPKGAPAIQSRYVSDCIQFLAAEGIMCYRVECCPERADLVSAMQLRLERYF